LFFDESYKCAFLQKRCAGFSVMSIFIQTLGVSQQQTEFMRYCYSTERADLGLSGHSKFRYSEFYSDSFRI